jgi:hypothetical protein
MSALRRPLPTGAILMFSNAIASGSGGLVLPSIHSPNYVAGSAGWSINRDGTAEFNALGGTFQINNNGIFFYIPSAGVGNLRMSITNADGTDPYGNVYKAGLFVNQRQEWFTGDNSHTLTLNPNGQVGPEILFTPAGFNALMHIIVEGANNRMLIEPTLSSGAKLEVNGPFLVSGGYQGVSTSAGAMPPFTTTGSFVEYLSASWTPLTLKCPASETIVINTTAYGYNNNTAGSTLSISPKLKQGATVLMNPAQAQNGPNLLSPGAGVTNLVYGFNQYVVGTDVLSGRAGQTLTVIPCWRISSGSATTSSVSYASMSAYPLPYVQPQSG